MEVVKRRRALGMRTQQALADAAGVSKSTITRLERLNRDNPIHRRSPSWELVEKALRWPDGYIERRVNEIEQIGYVIRASELSEIEPRARAAIKNALMATLPDVTAGQIIAAETAAIKALREQGILPPEE
jgi:DNA-binding XRE family transcriptional regulator